MRALSIRFHLIVTAFAAGVAFVAPAGGVAAQSAQTADDMDALFAELAQTEGEGWAAAESDILRAWSRSGSAAADLLLKRGYGALDAGDLDAAIGHFTALTDHAPDFADGWAARAEAFYLDDRLGPAAADLAVALRLEPRHWPALTLLATMLEEMNDQPRALAAYRETLAINPHQPDAEDAIARLSAQADGTPI